MRERWTGWTAVTTPIDGCAIAARSAISPETYIPISSTAASCSGPRRISVSGSPTSLFWLPSVLSVRRAAPRTVATASLVDVLAMLPVIPTTSGSNRRRQPAATAPRATSASATRTIGDVAETPGLLDLAGDQHGRGPTPDGVVQVQVAVGALARQRDEQLTGCDQPRIDGGASDRPIRPCQQPAAGQADEVIDRERCRRRRSASALDGSTSLTTASVPWGPLTGP